MFVQQSIVTSEYRAITAQNQAAEYKRIAEDTDGFVNKIRALEKELKNSHQQLQTVRVAYAQAQEQIIRSVQEREKEKSRVVSAEAR